MGEKAWFAHYDAGVPRTLAPYPHKTLLDYVANTARQWPPHPALFFKGRYVTYGELTRLSDAFAAALLEQGVKPGDRLALFLPNCPQFVIAELGAWKAGAIVVPLNPLYSSDELHVLLADCGAETVVALAPFATRVREVQPRTAVKRIIATRIQEYLPPLLRVAYTVTHAWHAGQHRPPVPDALWFGELLKAYRHAPRPTVTIDPDDPAVILMSGGTTGTPKGVVGRHAGLVAAGLQIHAWLRPVWDDWHDIVLLPLPLSHAYGHIAGQSVAFVGYNPLALIPDPRNICDLLRTIQRVQPAFIAGVPALFTALLRHPDVAAGTVDFRSIKSCFSGAAPLTAATKQRFEALTGGRMVEGYSLTEAMLACTCQPVRGPQKMGSVGLPLPDVEIDIVDQDRGACSLAPMEVGEVILRAPQIMTSYWQKPQATAEALRTRDAGDPWLYTGDIGYRDADGYLFLVDRKTDLIKTSGYQVWPREIEDIIATHPAVAEVGVAKIPDAVKGEVAKAWVVLRPGTSTTAGEIRAYCHEHLAPYKVPAVVELCRALPRTPLGGKVLRRPLGDIPRMHRDSCLASLTLWALLCTIGLLVSDKVSAHCDRIDGLVVMATQKALEVGKVSLVLIPCLQSRRKV
jgi:long-chain acyl-CoA synthetase